MNLNDLRKSPLFEGLSDEELQRLMDMAEPVSWRAGDILMRQGEPGDAAHVVIRGELEIQKQTGQSLIKIDVRNPGDVVGEMALLSRASRTATVVAKTDGETLRIPPEAFEELLKSSSTAAMAVLRWVMARLNQNESLLHQQEKMAALGTLSAGLAHELNNPAAAAQRNAAELGRTLFKLQALNHQIESRALKENLAGWLDSFVRETSRRFSSPVKLDALERIDRVDELQSWLEERQIEPAWELAPALVSFGWSAGELENLRENVLFEVIVQWLGIACLTIARVSEIQQAMERISSIVQAVKSYTYLDQARLLEVDIHEGLENTLVIMQHKLKRGISVR
ncbi:MAG TPA: cyclic nucleotide-binding domain-containing protein, partial [Nitrosospira sp.]